MLFYKNLLYLHNSGRINIPSDVLKNKTCDISQAIKISEKSGYSIEHLTTIDIEERERVRALNIKLLVLDIDGCMTDGKIIYTEKGDELKQFNAMDGLACRRWVKEGKTLAFLSHGIAEGIAQKRAQVLGAKKLYLGNEPKIDILNKWVAEEGIGMEQVCFMGDDLNDLEVINVVGFSVCPKNAVNPIKHKVHTVLTKRGGAGAIRELIDNYLL